MTTPLELLTVQDIYAAYGGVLSRSLIYQILGEKDCPIISGGRGKKYLIEREAFENYLRKRKER